MVWFIIRIINILGDYDEIIENFRFVMEKKSNSNSEIVNENKVNQDNSTNIKDILAENSEINTENSNSILLNYVSDSIVLHTVEGLIINLNDSAARAMGKPAGKLIGSNIFEHLAFQVAESRKIKINEVLKNIKPVVFQEVIEENYFDTTISPILKNNKVEGIVVFSKNITETVKALETIREALTS